MAFPTTSILDNFNRANATLDGSSNWTTPLFSHASWEIVGNQLDGSSNANQNNIWNVSYTDSEAYITLTDMAYGTNRVAVGCRFSTGTVNGYFAFYVHDATALRLFRYDAGVATQLGSDASFTASAGDKIGISAIGTTIKAYKFASGSWTEVISVTDANYSSGLLWLYGKFDTTNLLVDDFGGGEVVASTAVPVLYHQRTEQGLS